MAAQYQPVASTEQILEPVYTARPRSSHACWSVSLAVVSLVNICILLFSINIWHSTGDATPATCEAAIATPGASTTLVTDGAHNTAIGLAMVDDLPAAYVSFHWKTPWGAPNATWADALWDNINTAHGHIAIDHEWAAKNNWTASMDVPGKPGKGLYLLQAYHQLHCLRIARSTMLSLHRQTPPLYPMHHALHCFDALRQNIMCHSDNTPLYGIGNGMSGDGQKQQCKDWNALRDYATENTACFRDGKPGMSFEDRFGDCDDGTDGLELYAPGDGS